MAIASLLTYAPGIISGAARFQTSLRNLQKLSTQALPTYDTRQAQRNVNMYQRRFDQGLSPEERAAMGQQFQSEQAGMYRQTSERAGGQISNFLGRVTAMDRVRNAMRTGTMMAQERRAAMSGLAGARQGLQSQLNAQTQMDMRRRMAEEQSLGQGMRGGLNTLEKSLTYGLYGALQGAGNQGGEGAQEPSPMERFSTAPRTNYGGPFTGENRYINPLNPLGDLSNSNYEAELDLAYGETSRPILDYKQIQNLTNGSK